MKAWLKASNLFCFGGVSAITAALWQIGIGWALGWVGIVAIGVGAFLERRGS